MAIARPRMTEEEFIRLPDTGNKWELVDGEPKEVPASWEHDAIGMLIGHLIYEAGRKIGFVAGSQAGFRMLNTNIRCPDVSVTRRERAPEGPGKGFWGESPDLCIEVISPSEDRADMARKVREYFASGAQVVWHVFPDEKSVRVFTSPDDSRLLTADDEIDEPDLLPGFRAKVSELFQID